MEHNIKAEVTHDNNMELHGFLTPTHFVLFFSDVVIFVFFACVYLIALSCSAVTYTKNCFNYFARS